MTLSTSLAVIASLLAVVALLSAVHSRRRIEVIKSKVSAVDEALEQERRDIDDSIATAHRATVAETAALIENLLSQLETDVTARVAEALALAEQNLNPSPVADTRDNPADPAQLTEHAGSDPRP